MASEWSHYSLDDLCNLITDGKHGDSQNEATSGYYFLSVKDVFDNRLVYENARQITKSDFLETHRRTNLEPGDILFTNTGTIGRMAIAPDDPKTPRTTFQKSVAILKPKRNLVQPRFLYYTLKFDNARLSELAAGTTQKNLLLKDFRSFEVKIPATGEQHAITHILGALDDKIELNRRMNETLEAMARALFKSWFVDFDPVRAKAEGRDPGLPKVLADLFPDLFEDSEFGEIPRGWKVGPLGRYFNVGLGGAWGRDDESDRATVGVHCLRGIDCHELAEGRDPDVPVRWVSPKQKSDRQLSDGTVLIEGSGSYCGRSIIWNRAYGQLVGEPIGYSNFCKRLDPICSASQAIVCWMQMRQAYRDGVIQSFRTGTAFPNFDVHGALANLIVVVPPVPLADAYAREFKFSQRLDLIAQSRTLAALRDALLPKLISGELRLKDADNFIVRHG